ncbi:672_t:CDS:1, partial [Ambispora gerdemannii]
LVQGAKEFRFLLSSFVIDRVRKRNNYPQTPSLYNILKLLCHTFSPKQEPTGRESQGTDVSELTGRKILEELC